MNPVTYTMLDLKGLDLASVRGQSYPGLYNSIYAAMNRCQEIILCNWFVAGILIPPTYCLLDIDGQNVISINNKVFIYPDDTIEIPDMGTNPRILELSITQNGEYVVPVDYDGFNPVNVDVQPPLEEITITENGEYLPSTGYYGIGKVIASITTGVPLLTRAEWNALTTQEKHSYNLVAVQDAISGYNRGELLYGADYIPPSDYIPYSDPTKIVCEANVSNFDGGLTWGDGDKPVTFSSTPSVVGDAVSIPVKTSGLLAYVDLGANNTPFTAYVVMKMVSPTTYSRALASTASRSSGQAIMLYGNPVYVSSWGSDTSTGVSGTDYFVGVIQFAQSGSAKATVYNHSLISKTPSAVGRYITLGRTDIDPSTSNAEPCDIMVKYIAVVEDVDSDSAINQNLQNLYNTFIQGG